MNFRIWILILVIALLGGTILTGCNSPSQQLLPEPTAAPTNEQPSGPIVLTDGLERTVQLDQPAQKIISIAPSNTEILYAIGAGSQLVGRDEFSDYPAEAKELPSVGGGFGALDTETMVALKPDLVLASQLTPQDQVEALEKLGLKVYLLANPTDIEDMFANLKTIGTITGKETQAGELIDSLTARVAAVDEKLVGTQKKPLVFYELDSTDPNAPWTAGPGSFIDTLISRAGGSNLGSKLSDAYAQLSVEQLLIDQPDVIVVGDYTWGGVTAEAVMARASWAALNAIKQSQVFIFDDNLVSRPGPRLVDGLEAMAKLIHPELYK